MKRKTNPPLAYSYCAILKITTATKKKSVLWIIILCLLFLGSCASYPNDVQQIGKTPNGIVPKQATMTREFPSTPIPSSSISPTQSPTVLLTTAITSIGKITPEPSNTSSFTLTPQVTLPSETAIPYIAQLFDTNLDCELPCWWGIIPGKTPWLNARNFLAQFAEIFESNSLKNPSILVGEVTFEVPQQIYPRKLLTHAYVTRDGIVESIEINPLGKVEKFLLSNFLKGYGEPEEIWISTYRNIYQNEGSSSLPFMIALYYPTKGILAYTGSEKIAVKNGFVNGCENNHIISSLYLWSPEKEMNFDQAAHIFRIKSGDMAFYPIDQATNLGTSDFYNIFLKGEDYCLESPVDMWPGQ